VLNMEVPSATKFTTLRGTVCRSHPQVVAFRQDAISHAIQNHLDLTQVTDPGPPEEIRPTREGIVQRGSFRGDRSEGIIRGNQRRRVMLIFLGGVRVKQLQ
jgi:hypothetical protein